MSNKEITPRALRLSEIYNESGMRSVSSFAREVGVRQSTMGNFFAGIRDPSDSTLERVLEKYPQYNRRWLLDGTGEKYNSEYVEVRNEPAHLDAEKSGLMEKIASLYEKLVAQMERCQSLEDQLKQAKEMIDELKRQNSCGGEDTNQN